MDDRNVKIGVGMMLRQAAEFGEAQAERRANDLDMRLQVALLENQELRSHISELEAQLRHEEKRRAELDSENASLSTESDQVWLRATAAEDRMKELEAQLSRGVFVREMSDEELLDICDAHAFEPLVDVDQARLKCVRACIAAATKLPEGSVRWTEDAYVRDRVVYDSEDRPVDGIEVDVADSGGVIHHVYVPEPVDSPETAR